MLRKKKKGKSIRKKRKKKKKNVRTGTRARNLSLYIRAPFPLNHRTLVCNSEQDPKVNAWVFTMGKNERPNVLENVSNDFRETRWSRREWRSPGARRVWFGLYTRFLRAAAQKLVENVMHGILLWGTSKHRAFSKTARSIFVKLADRVRMGTLPVLTNFDPDPATGFREPHFGYVFFWTPQRESPKSTIVDNLLWNHSF